MARLVLASVALASVFSMASPSGAQDGSLSITVSLEATQFAPSGSKDVAFLVEYRNTLGIPLRWHPPVSVYDSEMSPPGGEHAAVCIEGTDGRKYIATGMDQPGAIWGPSVGGNIDRTMLLAPRASDWRAGTIGNVSSASSRWGALMDPSTRSPEFSGALPPGEYDVWVQMYDGPEGQLFPERAPAIGMYKSNRVRIVVAAQGSAAKVASKLKKAKDHPGGIFRHRGELIARSDALVPYGIRIKVGPKGELSLSRNDKPSVRITLDTGASGKRSLESSLFGARLSNTEGCLIPLKKVSKCFGLLVRYDERTKTYDLSKT
jgi:hypothetical protein